MEQRFPRLARWFRSPVGPVTLRGCREIHPLKLKSRVWWSSLRLPTALLVHPASRDASCLPSIAANKSGATCWSGASCPILHYDRTGLAAHTPAGTLSCAQIRFQRSRRAEAICVGHTHTARSTLFAAGPRDLDESRWHPRARWAPPCLLFSLASNPPYRHSLPSNKVPSSLLPARWCYPWRIRC